MSVSEVAPNVFFVKVNAWEFGSGYLVLIAFLPFLVG